MEVQTKAIFKTRTPRVKCVTSHPSYPDILVCLFTGEIRLYDPKTFDIKKSAQICEVPIRTAVIVPSKDCILVGNDEGCILVVDLGNLSVVETVKAHDDFVRKIVVDENNQRIITVSDDNRTKLWSFSDGIVMVNKYKDSKHFVMDACLYPSDNNHFFTVSLDGKIRMYSVASNKLLKVFKGHEKGVNSICFINPETFITGSDDCTVMVWDVRRPLPVAVLRGHTKNVNAVKPLKGGFASCSEDSTVRFWNSEFKAVEVLNMQGRVWDLYVKENKVFVGSDEELSVFQELGSSSIAVLRENKIFYNVGNGIFSVRADDLGAYKELGVLDDSFEHFVVSPNGKLIAVMGNLEISVYSTLGMRKKYADGGRDLCFIGTDSFVYLKDSDVVLVSRNEVESRTCISDISRILDSNSEKMIINAKKTAVYSANAPVALLHEFDATFQKAVIVGKYFILFDDQIHIFDDKFKEVDVLEYKIESFAEHEDMLVFSTVNKTFCLLFSGDRVHLSHLKYYGRVIGIRDKTIFYYLDGIKTDAIDMDFINFKKDFFNGLDPEPAESFRDKAISFFESLELHEKALLLCTDENQRFEILIKLNRLADALRSANSPIKYEKLGRKFLSLGEFNKASECFLKSGDLDSLLLTDVFGDKSHLGHVAKRARESGRNNLAFLASYKDRNYELCKELLRDTPFYHAFKQFYVE